LRRCSQITIIGYTFAVTHYCHFRSGHQADHLLQLILIIKPLVESGRRGGYSVKPITAIGRNACVTDCPNWKPVL